MLKTTKNWLLLEDKDKAPHVWGHWITIKKTASLVLNTLHHFQLHPHQDLASHEGGEILLEEHGVGGITVCYGTCLWSLVLWARAYHCDCIIILAFHSTYETQQGYWWSWNFGFLKSVPKLVEVVSLNQVNSGDSNGVIHVSIPALGDENRKLPCFLFTFSSLESPWSTGSYYTPLERYE